MIFNFRVTDFLNQRKFPRLWLIFQILAGGTFDKRRLCLSVCSDEKSLLEVGCSSGNIASAFSRKKNLQYTGLDIDQVAISFAQERFKSKPKFRFICKDLTEFSEASEEKFEIVLFAGIFHHVSDDVCRALLDAGRKLLSANGKIVVIDVLAALPSDNWYVKVNTHSFEEGQFVREESQLNELIKSISGMKIVSSSVKYIGSTFFSLPKVARFATYELLLVGDL